MSEPRVVVVGAGMGGLTAAAMLARAGLDVTVLEAHVYGGGCAGTFYHQGYRFDAGATLAAGFGADGVMQGIGELLGIQWPVVPADVAMMVHLPDGSTVTRWSDGERWQAERVSVFGAASEPFWRWQERTADLMWDVAQWGLPWPPASGRDWTRLLRVGGRLAETVPARLPGLARDAVQPVAARLGNAAGRLRSYVDGQLLISAQATSERANALYGAAALDMPRRGVAHVKGGMGSLAAAVADAVRRHGGRVLYRQRVTRVETSSRQPVRVVTKAGGEFPAEAVLFNLPPWDAAALLQPGVPPARSPQGPPPDGWGAFVVYVGLDGAGIPDTAPLHSQVLAAQPYGEGNSVFLSLSLPDDLQRAPVGHRTLTLSTHTRLEPWWRLFREDRQAYEDRKQEYTARVLQVAAVALPGLHGAARLVMPGTPVSFQRFTGRSLGWVGGYPQTGLLRNRSPRLGRGLWLVGDSIFPGQSVLATALGGLRVAGAVLHDEIRVSRGRSVHQTRGDGRHILADLVAEAAD